MRRFFPRQNSISLSIPDRRGTILVWFAVFLFALFPLAALIVDFGLVTLTRRQMQAAAKTAALEGLRFHDSLPSQFDAPHLDDRPKGLSEACPEYAAPPSPGALPSDKRIAWCDCARRWAAGNLVENLFDDDLNPGADQMQFGAGPLLELTGGIQLEGTDFYASQLMTSPQPLVHKPQLQVNLDNAPEGDMVAGTYDGHLNLHAEHGDYSRDDFAADGGSNASSFLVRLRRTDAGTLPFLFGRGGITRAVNRSDPAALWNQREYGTPVWATAIAQAQPVMTVGVSDPTRSIRGLAPVAISSMTWETLDQGVETPVSPVRLIDHREIAPVGNSIPDLEGSPSDRDEEMYLPVYLELDHEGNMTAKIIGFGLARVIIENGNVSITKHVTQIALSNATTAWLYPPSDLSSEDLGILLGERDRLQSTLLLAPALQRTIQ